jgi:hypothetical protein
MLRVCVAYNIGQRFGRDAISRDLNGSRNMTKSLNFQRQCRAVLEKTGGHAGHSITQAIVERRWTKALNHTRYLVHTPS